jgi:hypothetical protein
MTQTKMPPENPGRFTSSMRELLDELDELKLITVAVHVDLGLRRLEAMIDSKSLNTDDLKSN